MRLGVVDSQSLAVVSQHDVAVVVDVKHGDMAVARLVDMYGRMAVQSKESGIGGGDIDISFVVFTDIQYSVPALSVVEVSLQRLAVIA